MGGGGWWFVEPENITANEYNVINNCAYLNKCKHKQIATVKTYDSFDDCYEVFDLNDNYDNSVKISKSADVSKYLDRNIVVKCIYVVSLCYTVAIIYINSCLQ